MTGTVADEVFRRAQELGWGQDGFAKAARILEEIAGVELRAEARDQSTTYQQQDPRRG